MNKIKTLIIDDEIIIARDLERIVKHMNLGSVEIAINYEMALSTCKALNPEIVIMDINFESEKDGVDLAIELQEILFFELIFITAESDQNTLTRAKHLNPRHYLIKPYDDRQVEIAIELCLDNLSNLRTKERIFQNIQSLTKTEQKILRKIFENLTSQQIAHEFSISQKTVENHRHNICNKLKLPHEKNSLLKWTLRNQEILIDKFRTLNSQ